MSITDWDKDKLLALITTMSTVCIKYECMLHKTRECISSQKHYPSGINDLEEELKDMTGFIHKEVYAFHGKYKAYLENGKCKSDIKGIMTNE